MKREFNKCFLVAVTLLLTIGSTEAFSMYHQLFSFSGDIDFVLEKNAPTISAAFDVGTPISGDFRYGVDISDALVTPHGDNETDYEFFGLPYQAMLYSTTPTTVINDTTVVISDGTWMYGPVVEFSQILDITIENGDVFDGWTVRTDEEPIDGLSLGVTFYAFSNTDLMGDQNYSSEPPASIGFGGFDGALFWVRETNATGDITFEGIGKVDSYSVSTIPVPSALLLTCIGTSLTTYLRRRKSF